MAVANAIKSKRIIQMTSGEAGIENRQSEVKRTETRLTIRILRDFAGEPLTMDQIDKTFYQEYID